jgi:hypothetical protein
MRTNLLFSLGVVLLVSACDNPESIGPGAAKPNASVVAQVGSARAVSAQGKPQDQVGFTKVVAVYGVNKLIQAGQAAAVTATCPAGTTVISGGHGILGYVSSATPPWFKDSGDDSANGWGVVIDNSQPGASVVNIRAIAYCAS